jgi:hypothetical protein
MEFERITVFTRDEYRAAQEPNAFEWRGNRFEIEQVEDRWLEGRPDSTRMPLRYYKVRTSDGRRFILRYHEFFTAWSVAVP